MFSVKQHDDDRDCPKSSSNKEYHCLNLLSFCVWRFGLCKFVYSISLVPVITKEIMFYHSACFEVMHLLTDGFEL